MTMDYEPSKEQIREMLVNLRSNKPVPATAIQFSGGEPTIRQDLFDLIRMAKELGFRHIEVNTNGLRIAKSVDYCRSLIDAGMSTLYLQFDGLTSDVYMFTRGVDLLDIKKKAIENCRKAGLNSVVLVVTLIKGVNDHQLGDIIQFAVKNFDVIRCINVQPVSLCGRLPEKERKKMRITIPDFMQLVEEQSQGKIKTTDFLKNIFSKLSNNNLLTSLANYFSEKKQGSQLQISSLSKKQIWIYNNDEALMGGPVSLIAAVLFWICCVILALSMAFFGYSDFMDNAVDIFQVILSWIMFLLILLIIVG